MPLIDSHCHLDFPPLENNLDQIITRCKEQNISKFVIPGVEEKSWCSILELCQSYPGLYAAPGIHPCFLEQANLAQFESLNDILSSKGKIVAVGETGLDFFLKPYDESKQYLFFEQQIELAMSHRLPLILHVRKAHDHAAALLKKKKFDCGGIVHCYSGSLQQTKRYLELGFKLGIGGVITYPRSTRLQKIVKVLHLNDFVLETDAPDIPPFGKEGQINSPENLPAILNSFISYRTESEEEITDQLYLNTLDALPNLKK